MSLFLNIAKICLPPPVKKRYFAKLFALTAAAFQTSPPDMTGWNYDRCLREYALFTRNEAEKLFRQRVDLEPVKAKLNAGAYEIGCELRRALKVDTRNDIMQASRLLYKMLGIDFHMNIQGEITISRCFFSDYYTPETCRLISSLDAGILAGISGGGKLVFINRITEKADSCHANLIFPEEHS